MIEEKNFDYFMALSNITKEFKVFNNINNIKIWAEYKEYMEISKKHKKYPELFTQKRNLERANIDKIIKIREKNGIVFMLMHYGNYREVLLQLLTEVKKKGEEVLVIVDQDSYDNEALLEKWQQIYFKNNIKFVVAENAMILKDINQKLKNKGIVVLFLDGFTGFGNDKLPIKTTFITSKIFLRSGIFRFIAMNSIPLICIMENSDAIQFSNPIVSSNYLDYSDISISFFRQLIFQKPAQWRMWFRFHKFVLENKTNYLISRENSENYIYRPQSKSLTLSIDNMSGEVYKIVEECK